MYKPRILVIAPFDGMRETIHSVAKKRQDCEIQVKVGNLEQGVQIVNETNPDSYDILISRGGTYELIKRTAQKPVVEIKFSPFDVLRSMKLAENADSRFAIMGYRNITQSAETLCNLLNNNVHVVTIDDDTDVVKALMELKQKEYQMIVSDTIGYVSADKAGLNAVLITSGSESIESAIDQSVQIIHHLQNELKFTSLFKSIASEAYDSISIFDQNSTQIHHQVNNREIDLAAKDFLSQFIAGCIDDEFFEIERKLNGKALHIKRLPVTFQDDLFTVFTVIAKTESQYSKLTGVEVLTIDEIQPQSEFLANTDNLSHNNEVKRQIEQFSKLNAPILIVGEPGTGKKAAAFTLFKSGLYAKSLFYSIDCGLIHDKSWKYLMENENSPLFDKGITLYFNSIDSLRDEQARDLVRVITESNISERIQLIFSYVQSPESLSANPLYDYLKRTINCLTLRMHPLRETPEEIPSITTRYLNQLNASLGQEIVGFEPSAMHHIRTYDWPNNLSQFKRIVRQLVLNAAGPYIREADVVDILKGEKMLTRKDVVQGTAVVDIDKPLNEINYDIIQAILQQDGMNQMKAADQLGISRSTIWRILKSGTK